MTSVIICTYNRSDSLKTTLDSLAQMTVPPDLSWELIVVDNNSNDRTREVVEEFAATSGLNVRYDFEGRQGKSYALNRGIEGAKGEIIAFTDDDVAVDKFWLFHLTEVFERYGCLGVGGRVVAVWDAAKPSWLQEEGPYALASAIVSFDWGEEVCDAVEPPIGANMAFKKEVFAEHGVFRTDLGKMGNGRMIICEDFDFGRRLLNKKQKVVYTPKAVVYHPVAKERIRKAYFRSWYFNWGRARVRREGLPKRAVYYFGVPRFFFRTITENFIRWITTLEPKRRFYHELQAYLVAGMIVETRRLSAETRRVVEECVSA